MQTSRKFSQRSFVFAAAMFAITAACGDDDTGNPSVRGDYPLRRVNGAPLPYVSTSADGVKTEVLDDVLSLYSGNTFSQTSHVRITTNGQTSAQTLSETGTYAGLGGTAILFQYNSGKTPRQAVLNNRTFTFSDGGVFRDYIKD